MKILAVSDIHGSHYWENAKARINDYDKIVFLGDYFDSWTNKWPDQMRNFRHILNFRIDNPDKVAILWGNHDTSYYLNERCSGHQPQHEIDIDEILNYNRDLLDVTFVADKWLFAHGGFSSKWMSAAGIKEPIAANQLFKERPNFFRWVGPDGYGNNPTEGPLWIRPDALISCSAKLDYNQCVGHTERDDNPKIIRKNKHKYVLTDTEKHDVFTIIDTQTDEITFEKVNLIK